VFDSLAKLTRPALPLDIAFTQIEDDGFEQLSALNEAGEPGHRRQSAEAARRCLC